MLAELLLSEAATWHINQFACPYATLRCSTSSIEIIGTQVVCTPAVTPSQDPIVQDGQHMGVVCLPAGDQLVIGNDVGTI